MIKNNHTKYLLTLICDKCVICEFHFSDVEIGIVPSLDNRIYANVKSYDTFPIGIVHFAYIGWWYISIFCFYPFKSYTRSGAQIFHLAATAHLIFINIFRIIPLFHYLFIINPFIDTSNRKFFTAIVTRARIHITFHVYTDAFFCCNTTIFINYPIMYPL